MPKLPPKAVLRPLDKRIVLLHCKGPWKDIYQIVGAQSDTLAALDLAELPAFIEQCEMGDGRVTSASMVKVTPRWVLYRENTPPEGKFNEFNPAQV
jgi:hypothetical protein